MPTNDETKTLNDCTCDRERISPAIKAAFMRLAMAALLQAFKDAGTDSPQGIRAREWLLSDDAELYLYLVGIERIEVERWIQAGAHISR